MSIKIMSIVGARPNFMKIAPFCRAIDAYNSRMSDGQLIENILVHSGQHYDERMNRSFFDALGIPDADINLGVGSGSHADQVGNTMIAFEKVLREHKPDWVIVVGDVNATCACSITAKKEHVKLAHIEAGLRSYDLDMPEEINRMVTDRLSDLLFTPDRLSSENLRREGVPEDRIKFVGNIMIDTLEANRNLAASLSIDEIIKKNSLRSSAIPSVGSNFALLTLHRPSNVDNKEVLTSIIQFLFDEVAPKLPLIWPIHPRTKNQLEAFGLWDGVANTQNFILLQPIGYHEMLRMNMDARVMLTDSGGLQEECCILGTPCLTLRKNTERPVTLKEHGGVSVLMGDTVERLYVEFSDLLNSARCPQRPELWDGNTSERIVKELARQFK